MKKRIPFLTSFPSLANWFIFSSTTHTFTLRRVSHSAAKMAGNYHRTKHSHINDTSGLCVGWVGFSAKKQSWQKHALKLLCARGFPLQNQVMARSSRAPYKPWLECRAFQAGAYHCSDCCSSVRGDSFVSCQAQQMCKNFHQKVLVSVDLVMTPPNPAHPRNNSTPCPV